jgi:hypothetical protein
MARSIPQPVSAKPISGVGMAKICVIFLEVLLMKVKAGTSDFYVFLFHYVSDTEGLPEIHCAIY